MKILTGHDYYDGAGWSIDPTCVFERTPVSTLPHKLDYPFALQAPFYRNDKDYALTPGVAYVGGKRYPFLEKRTTTKGWRAIDPFVLGRGDTSWTRMDVSFHFDPEECLSFIQTLFKDSGPRILAKNTDAIHTWMRPISQVETNWLIDTQTSTLIVRKWRTSEANGLWMERNTPTLKDIGLFKTLDPATAHRDLSAWISGVLTQPRLLTTLSDASKLQKAGFDKKSFRKDPEYSR